MSGRLRRIYPLMVVIERKYTEMDYRAYQQNLE
jgi:hypothetical protein